MDPKRVKVAEIMSTSVLALRTGATLREAMVSLERRGISGAPVLDEGGSCAGVFSLSNAARAGDYYGAERPGGGAPLEATGAELDRETVAEWMSRDLKSVRSTTSVEAAARQMSLAGIHRLLVIDEGALVGIVSSLDIVRFVAGLARAAEEPVPEVEASSRTLGV